MFCSIDREDNLTTATKRGLETWCKTETLDRLGGDEELLNELIEIFVVESPKLMQKLREVIAVSDVDAIMRASHSIKGELACLGGVAAAGVAQEIETMGKNKELSGVADALARLESELVAFTALLRQPSPLQS